MWLASAWPYIELNSARLFASRSETLAIFITPKIRSTRTNISPSAKASRLAGEASMPSKPPSQREAL